MNESMMRRILVSKNLSHSINQFLWFRFDLDVLSVSCEQNIIQYHCDGVMKITSTKHNAHNSNQYPDLISLIIFWFEFSLVFKHLEGYAFSMSLSVCNAAKKNGPELRTLNNRIHLMKTFICLIDKQNISLNRF
ncbi:Set1/Ash2 histone methyltransferase complex subunit ASH2 [Sarcoptes scabiei]|nr:Set1/Ash2 histone methyltransferase complex subunit ASH2 [Sarcoptes scabiei]